jgi:putative transposase
LLCGLFGKTRQGYYKQVNQIEETILKEEMVLSAIQRIKSKAQTNRWGVRKLQILVNQELSSIGVCTGRDYLFDLLRANNMLVRSRKRKYFTTQSHHWLKKYDNLLINKEISAPNQVWVSDITYIKGKRIAEENKREVYYLYLITDAYSQKLVGWNLSLDLKATSAVSALRKAISSNKGNLENLIHHSDRGVQYCSTEYTDLLIKNHIQISMSNPGSPHENAIAERINGILKDEWIYEMKLESFDKVVDKLKQIIRIYNNYRPHNSIDNKTPEQVHSLGFNRHNAVRVIGEKYRHKKREKPMALP